MGQQIHFKYEQAEKKITYFKKTAHWSQRVASDTTFMSKHGRTENAKTSGSLPMESSSIRLHKTLVELTLRRKNGTNSAQARCKTPCKLKLFQKTQFPIKNCKMSICCDVEVWQVRGFLPNTVPLFLEWVRSDLVH
ncbi:hypothetical protein AVEN_199040-1 [Araneus ventricosus]|uniref:Uncharacterized protein n=1 Tax=Araneus ventricosus TaxID=182803 RepID=A0A4Y2G6I9_ARAVE|nr:hypothetical protein AVEN_199040-1 [Araneus ventricosus]